MQKQADCFHIRPVSLQVSVFYTMHGFGEGLSFKLAQI